MSIEAGGIHHLSIRVTDLARAKAFYIDTLGFSWLMDFPGGFIASAAGSLIGFQGDAPKTTSGDRFDPFRVGLDHLALAVADAAELETMRQQLDAAGVPNNGVEDDPMLGAKYISFQDPDGIAWELYWMPPR